MWRRLHTQARKGLTQAWLDRFTGEIPCGECKRHWIGAMKFLPPDFSSAEASFVWTVRAHNLVNRRLGKPAMAMDDARKMYPR